MFLHRFIQLLDLNASNFFWKKTLKYKFILLQSPKFTVTFCRVNKFNDKWKRKYSILFSLILTIWRRQKRCYGRPLLQSKKKRLDIGFWKTDKSNEKTYTFYLFTVSVFAYTKNKFSMKAERINHQVSSFPFYKI